MITAAQARVRTAEKVLDLTASQIEIIDSEIRARLAKDKCLSTSCTIDKSILGVLTTKTMEVLIDAGYTVSVNEEDVTISWSSGEIF